VKKLVSLSLGHKSTYCFGAIPKLTVGLLETVQFIKLQFVRVSPVNVPIFNLSIDQELAIISSASILFKPLSVGVKL